MALTALVGRDVSRLNLELMRYAVNYLPAILIDCANSADPHKLYPAVDLVKMQQLYVFELELLHKFRDTLRHLPTYVKKLDARLIVVTTSDHLLNYHDEAENSDIYRHAWLLMRKIGISYDIVAGVSATGIQCELAKKYCTQLKTIDF